MKRKLPNVVTAFGLCCGLFVIFKMNLTGFGEVTKELLNLTAGLILLAGFADLLDGALARVMKVESEFGGFFDSMADAVTFGVAPAVIVLKTLSVPSDTDMSYLLTTAAMIYSICGVLRLVRFNVSTLHASEDAVLLEAHKKNFTGLPIPAAAAALISSNLFFMSEEVRKFFNFSFDTHVWLLFSQLIILGYFMVSRWKFPSLKTLRIKVKSFAQVFLIVVFTVFFIFYGLIKQFSLFFFLASWGYILVAWTLSIIRLISGKKSPTLADYEPDSDDLEE